MEVRTVTKKSRLSQGQLVRFQLLYHFTLIRSLTIGERDLDILTLLGLYGVSELSSFCQNASEHLETSAQTIRNRVNELIKREIIYRHKDENGITIDLNLSELETAETPVLLQYQFLTIESAQA